MLKANLFCLSSLGLQESDLLNWLGSSVSFVLSTTGQDLFGKVDHRLALNKNVRRSLPDWTEAKVGQDEMSWLFLIGSELF